MNTPYFSTLPDNVYLILMSHVAKLNDKIVVVHSVRICFLWQDENIYPLLLIVLDIYFLIQSIASYIYE
jgi:hypothetical protein